MSSHDECLHLVELACHAGISLRTAYKWLARFRSGGPAALVDRRSVRRTQRRTLDPQQQQQATALRHERLAMRRLAKALAVTAGCCRTTAALTAPSKGEKPAAQWV
jgi:transposase